jgi:hypothetical protein
LSVSIVFILFGVDNILSTYVITASVAKLPNFEDSPNGSAQTSTHTSSLIYFSIGSIIIFTALFFATWRYCVRGAAHALVADDRRRYDNQWIGHKFLTKSSFDVEVAKIGQTLSVKNKRTPKQKNVANLSKLYTLADEVHPWFLTCVERWHSVVNEPRPYQQKITFSPSQCTLKAVERSIQKIHRVYGGKLTRLVDVVRACIICLDLSEVVVVLNAVTLSPEVEIVRWKNGYVDNNAKQKHRGGHRDVQLILRTTGCAECPDFLVELQICLAGIFLLKMENEKVPDSDVTKVSESKRARERDNVAEDTIELCDVRDSDVDDQTSIRSVKENNAQAVNTVFAVKAMKNDSADCIDHTHTTESTAFTTWSAHTGAADQARTIQTKIPPAEEEREGEREKLAKLAYCPHCRLITSGKQRKSMKHELGKLSGHEIYKIRRNLLAE